MRLRLILEAPFTHRIHPNAEVLTTPDQRSTVVIWDVNPNIALGSPVHLEKLVVLLRLAGVWETASMSLFAVRWSSSSEWVVGSYLDPARSAYEHELREEASMFLTNDASSAMLTSNDTLKEADLFWLPLTTSALRYQSIWNAGDALVTIGGAKRRVWKQLDAPPLFTLSSIAACGFPQATLPPLASSGGTQGQVSTFRWCFRVGCDQQPFASGDQRQAGWYPLPGNNYFAHERGKHRGNSVIATKTVAVHVQGSSEDASESSDADITQDQMPGITLPSVLIGFAVKSCLDDAEEAWCGAHSGASPASIATRRLWELTDLSNACCLLETQSGGIFVGGTTKHPAQFADLDAYVACVGMSFTFSVDMSEGICNIHQNDRLVSVVQLPPAMRDAISSSFDTSGLHAALSPVVQICSPGTFVDIF